MNLPAEDIFGNTKKLKFILNALDTHRKNIKRDLTVLDFGCGNGANVAAFVIPKSGRYIGVDLHTPSLNYARANYAQQHAEFLTTVPKDVVFDAIIYADLLEHVEDPLAVIQSCLPQLAEDGIIIGSVPNGYGPCEIEKFIDRHLHLYGMLRAVKRAVLKLAGKRPNPPPEIPYNHESGHVIFFTRRSLRRMVTAAGLKFISFGHGGFVGADLMGNVITSRSFVRWNVKVADSLPYWIVSTWYFVLAKDDAI